ncbi:tryptophan halogenase family protein [Marinimicrobium sp. C2-29]|uniref:tryptophan halogenase family protein n=1 Tax=Marinimicrobium sp. C2-29 TaxID=3139825 RepID=UPI00313955CD
MSASNSAIDQIVIVGGGTAGWLTAGLLAADMRLDPRPNRRITLLESPDIPTVGVGEGTWPSMLETLRSIGLSETEFIRECDVSFKQGSRFQNWCRGEGERYDHPFTLPAQYGRLNLAEHWLQAGGDIPFAYAVSPQSAACDQGRAPKQLATPEYAFNLNYGYHLDAGKFTRLLQRHCVERLGVVHHLGEVTGVQSLDNGDIKHLHLKSGETLAGDLFIDCTGMASRLLGQHYQVPWVSQRSVLFNDSALAVQVPYSTEQSPIASQTLSTAHAEGWIWDIALPTRRGVGAVFSSHHIDQDSVHERLAAYVQNTDSGARLSDLSPRLIRFDPGHRQRFWQNNCVAIGLSAGFIEPLEATALVLVERSAQFLVQQMPENREEMSVVSRRFNQRFSRHWDNIIGFLKLHYVLSAREDSDYWRDHRAEESVPDELTEQLLLWRSRSPWTCDSLYREELFPSASYQYILYGMRPDHTATAGLERRVRQSGAGAHAAFHENGMETRKLLQGLPDNRTLLNHIRQHGLHTV